MKAEITNDLARVTKAQAQKSGGTVGHWATMYWNKRKVQSSLGITVHQSELTEYEVAILEFCEGTYNKLTAARRQG